MPWNCLYTLKNALNAGFEWPKFKAFSSSIRQTRVISDFMLSVTEKRNLRPDVAKRKETGIMQKVRSMRRTESEMDR